MTKRQNGLYIRTISFNHALLKRCLVFLPFKHKVNTLCLFPSLSELIRNVINLHLHETVEPSYHPDHLGGVQSHTMSFVEQQQAWIIRNFEKTGKCIGLSQALRVLVDHYITDLERRFAIIHETETLQALNAPIPAAIMDYARKIGERWQ